MRWKPNLKLLGIVAGALSLSSAGICQVVTDEQRLDSIWYGATEQMGAQSDEWFSGGHYLRSIQLLKLQVAIFPHDYESVSTLGWLLESVENHSEALATYVAFRRANPADPDSALPEAFYYFRMKAYAKVPPLLEPMIKRKPQPNVYRQLANAYERLDLLADSHRVWKTYLDIMPNDAQAKRNLEKVERKLRGENAAQPPTSP